MTLVSVMESYGNDGGEKILAMKWIQWRQAEASLASVRDGGEDNSNFGFVFLFVCFCCSVYSIILCNDNIELFKTESHKTLRSSILDFSNT